MKIRIKSAADHVDLILAFPTKLLCGKTAARILEKLGRRWAGEAMEKLPPGTVEALCAELRRCKDTRGALTLVDIESTTGDEVKITL